MYLNNVLKVLDVHNAQNFKKIAYTKPLKNCQYHVLLTRVVSLHDVPLFFGLENLAYGIENY